MRDNQAGRHLLGGMPTRPLSLPKSVTVPLAGSTDWTVLEISARVAEHGGMVQFGEVVSSDFGRDEHPSASMSVA